jgi:uncharacterized protein YndB with AHSA1/START domain
MAINSSLSMPSFIPTFILAICCGLSACASIPQVGTPENRIQQQSVRPDQINWPDKYRLEDATFTVKNSIEINAPPQVIWDILIDANSWSDWYVGAKNVRLPSSSKNPQSDGLLREDTVFSWKTMGQNFQTRVTEFEPPFRMGWESRKSTIKAYHAWLIVPTENGARVVTEESQYGFLAVMQKIFQPNKLKNLHDVWLAELKTRAEAMEKTK